MVQSRRNQVPLPPSSRGPGRSPFKAKTRVRISVGAQMTVNTVNNGVFLSMKVPQGIVIRVYLQYNCK